MMKLLLYDRDPERHLIEVTVLEPLGLVWLNPRDGLPDLMGFDAAAIHISDDQNDHLATQFIARAIPLALYSGEYADALLRTQRLKGEHPTSHISTVHVKDLKGVVYTALKNNNVAELYRDKLSDALEFLSALWAIGLRWEIGELGKEYMNADGTLGVARLGDIAISDNSKIEDLFKRIYWAENPPSSPLQISGISDVGDYLQALADLRDSLITWAES